MNNPWEQISPPTKDVNARRVDADHCLDLFWARNHLGWYLFVFEFLSEKPLKNIKIPDLAGIQSSYICLEKGNELGRLVFILNERSNWELFYSLCMDLIQATRLAKNSNAAVQIILRRLTRWHEFLKKNRNELLPEEKIKGLIGELYFIEKYLTRSFSPGQAIKYWQGPEGLAQDFNIGESAIEAKCQSGSSLPVVKISSADQLCPQLPEMYLFVITLGKATSDDAEAINLPNLIKSIRKKLEADPLDQMERFTDLLFNIGYVESDRYLDYSYILTAENMYKVSEDFPRLCSKDLPHGILKVSYNLDLSALDAFEGSPNWMKVMV